MWRFLGALLLIATLASAQSLHNNYEDCTELPDPTALPPFTKELLYCKAGNGLCAKDALGVIRCTGGSGGGSGTVTSISQANGIAVSPNPLTTTGTISLIAPVVIANGGTNGITQTAAFDNLSPMTTKGDLIGFDGTHNVRLGPGANGLCLILDSTATTGWKWSACSTGVTSITQGTGMNFSVSPITTTGTINLAVPVVAANGGTDNTTATNHATLVGNGSAWTEPVIPNCNGNANALLFTQATNLFSCNAAITATSAATVPFSGITSGTNTGQTMTVGNGSTITTTGTGVNDANSIDTLPVTAGPTLGQILIGQTATIAPKTVGGDSTLNSTGTMRNIGMQGLPVNSGGTDAQLWLNNSGILWAPQSMSGDVTITNGGVTSIGANKVTPAKMSRVAPAGLCLLSGGAGADPAYSTCPGGSTNPLLNIVTCTDCANNSPDRGAIITGQGSSPVLWTKLDPGPTFSVPVFTNPDIVSELLPDGSLHDSYSGVNNCGAGGGFFKSVTRDNPPTCAAVNLASGDVTGILPHGSGGTDQSIATANAMLVGNGTNWIETGLGTGTTHGPPVWRGFASGWHEDPHVFYADDAVDCTGHTDATTGWANILASLNASPYGYGTTTIYIPSGCKIRFKNPGANNAAGFIPSNTHIYCDDESAGFAVDTQTCHGGTYAGAACNASSECLGGGTCLDDFNNAAPGNPSTPATPCNSTTCFATTGGSTYTVLRDQGAGANDIFIENCSFFLAQASPYQACTGGTNAGDPCRQECDNATGAPNYPGQRCETNADCTSGTCLRVADCHTAGGTCGGVPSKVPSGPGQIRAIDAPNTTRLQLKHVQVFDALTADYVVKTGPNALIQNTDITREVTDCTSPLTTPSNSSCFGAGTTAGTCCYGAGYATNGISSGNKFNTQPANLAVQGLVVGPNSQVIAFTRSRGTTAFTGSGTSTRFDETVVVPFQQSTDASLANLGPGGLSTNGWNVGDHGQVTKSFALNLCGSGTGINFTAGDSGTFGDKMVLNSTCGSNGTGVQSTGPDNHIVGMNIKGVNGTGTGVTISGANSALSETYIEGTGASAMGVSLNSPGGLGNNIAITGIVVNSIPVDTLGAGIKTSGVATSSVMMNANTFTRLNGPALWITSGFGGNSNIMFQGNIVSYNGGADLSAAYHPCAIQNDNGTQVSIFGNQFNNGWRGVCGNTTLTNTQIGNNRFLFLGGAPIAVAGAGVNVIGNYFNSGKMSSSGFSTLSCDATCSGGAPVTRGTICFQDTDCTAGGNTCNASVHKCIPEAIVGYIGSPTSVQGGQHTSYMNNLMFNGTNFPIKQCTVAGPIGQFCQVASCNAGAVCGGAGPILTCQAGGTDTGKACCQTAAGATCAVRDPQPMVRVVDPGSAVGFVDVMFVGNQVFSTNAAQTDWVGIDMQSSAALGNISMNNSKIADNLFDAATTTGTTAIKFPSTPGTFANVSVTNNHFDGFTTPASTGNIANYQGAFGSITMENGHIAVGTLTHIPAGTVAADFGPLTGISDVLTAAEADMQEAMADRATFWKMTCTVDTIPTGNATRVMTLRVNGANAGGGAMTCTIDSTHKSCTTAAGAASAPVALNAGDLVDWQMASTIGTGTLPGKSVSCASYVSHDTAM